MDGEKGTRAFAVVPPRATASRRLAGPSSAARPNATIVTAVVPPAAAPARPRSKKPPSQQRTIAIAAVPPRKPESQRDTVAVPAIPTVVAGAPPHDLGLKKTLLATGDPDEIEIEIGESVIAPVVAPEPSSRVPRRTGRVPTFETLAVVAPARSRWLVVGGAVAVTLAALLAIA